MKKTRTSSRKKEHIAVTLTEDVSFHSKTPGFDNWDFRHNALPELNLSEVDPSVSFLGKTIAMPFIISGMTGGYAEARLINRQLAEVCAIKNLALGLGSQRQALEDVRYHQSFSVVRDVAPDIPVFGNIGAAEVALLQDASPILRLIEMIKADGFAVHLNPLQELLQPEGNTNFRGVLKGIEMLVRTLPVPVIVKEIGAGISVEVARCLIDAGVKIIDIAGAGGTSWAAVEILRKRKSTLTKNKDIELEKFWDWGIPTVESLRSVCALKSSATQLKVIASGGIASGIDIAKSIAFGADYTGAARPVLNALAKGGIDKALKLLELWEKELKGILFLTGSGNIVDLQKQKLYPKA